MEKNIVSNCCGAHIFNTDYDICPACLEHCVFIDLNEEHETEMREMMKSDNPKNEHKIDRRDENADKDKFQH